MLWWGLFDHELYVEWRDKRYGPYRPVGGPIPLHRYRRHAKSAREKRAETVAELARAITVPKSALSGSPEPVAGAEIIPLPKVAFADPDPWGEIAYASQLNARRAISNLLGKPLAELPREDLTFITQLVERTLGKSDIETAVRDRFWRRHKG